VNDYIGLVAGGGVHQLLSIEQVGRDIIVRSTSKCFDAVSSLAKSVHEMPAKDTARSGDQNCHRVVHAHGTKSLRVFV